MKRTTLLLFGVLCLLASARADDADFDDLEYGEEDVPADDAGPAAVFRLEHNLGGNGAWQARGDAQITVGKRSGAVAVAFEDHALSGDEIAALRALAASGGYYRVRLPAAATRGGAGGAGGAVAVNAAAAAFAADPPFIVASVPACKLEAVDFEETFLLDRGPMASCGGKGKGKGQGR